MVLRMLILKHIVHVVLYCALFLVGTMMVFDRNAWAKKLTRGQNSANRVSKLFHYSGRIFQVTGAVFGFLEIVAVMILIGGWMIDLLVGFAV
jgi:hypothetical protein